MADGGLSGGGLRTVYLAGTDDRIACACCVGMMTTWLDYLELGLKMFVSR